MTKQTKVDAYLDAQQSLHLYNNTRKAFADVFKTLPEEDFDRLTSNLILMVFHEGAIAQVMHFKPLHKNFKVLQLTIPHDISADAQRWVIAHELGHVMQERNWRETDGDGLEDDATQRALQWGFEKTDEIEAYLTNYRERFGAEKTNW